MTKKWYNYFISVDEADSAGPSPSSVKGDGESSKSAAQSVAEIASRVAAEPRFTTPGYMTPSSFACAK